MKESCYHYQHGKRNLNSETAKFEHGNFRIITKQLTNLIISQGPIYTVTTSEVSKLKCKIKTEKKERYNNILQNLED